MILLVRHGETDGNAKRVLQFPDTPLSERGHAQAARLAERLKGAPIGGLLASDYARAQQTAEAVRAVTGATLTLDPGLRERHFGELRGRAYADLETDPFAPDYHPPGGESWEELHARVDAVWERVIAAASRTEGHLVVVTHGLVCHSLFSRVLDLGDAVAPRGLGNTALTEIDPRPPFRVERVGCTAHLDAATAHDDRTVSGL
ncbi:MAG: histidine phosphatase family protein [Myxococcota bacterium]